MAITLDGSRDARKFAVVRQRTRVDFNWRRVLALVLNIAVWLIVGLVISHFMSPPR